MRKIGKCSQELTDTILKKSTLILTYLLNGINMEIKVLPQKDLKNFWKIQVEYLDNWSFEYLKKEHSKYPNLYIGCYEDNKLIGIAYGFIKKEIIILQGIAVKHDIWRKGIGSKILNFFEKQAKHTGKKIISVGSE